jgi:hypothetical protein
MSMHSLVGLSLTLAFATTVSATALARQPPALAKSQAATAQVLSTCTNDTPSTNGYRDMLARIEPKTRSRMPVQVARRPVLQRMGDHVVLLCPEGRVHGPGGYRDLDRRFNAEKGDVLIAKATLTGGRACGS